MTDVYEGLGLVSCMSSQLDHGWVSLRHTKQMGEGRATTKQKLLHERSQEESVAKENLKFTLKCLHHVETLSRGQGQDYTRQQEAG